MLSLLDPPRRLETGVSRHLASAPIAAHRSKHALPSSGHAQSGAHELNQALPHRQRSESDVPDCS
jgi:hypothetical protein